MKKIQIKPSQISRMANALVRHHPSEDTDADIESAINLLGDIEISLVNGPVILEPETKEDEKPDSDDATLRKVAENYIKATKEMNDATRRRELAEEHLKNNLPKDKHYNAITVDGTVYILSRGIHGISYFEAHSL